MAEAYSYQQDFHDISSEECDSENGEELISGFQAAPHEGGHVVVAIDIGTTFSGYAMSFSSGKFTIFAMQATDPYLSQGSTSTTKIPTTLLLKPDKTFHSFGHRAMQHYNRELDEDEQKEWYYFERFKMTLHAEKSLLRETAVSAASGKKMPIKTVFAHALRYFKETAIRKSRDQSETHLRDCDFEWVVTVPAIWDGGAKQIMREAAYEAGLGSESQPDKLQIALEPESASIYCKSVKHIGRATGGEGLVSRAFKPGTAYILADIGGGTADVTVHQVTGDGGVKELHYATGGAWGGTYVDKNFVKLLEEIFDADTIAEYKTEYPGDWVELVSLKFETNKRTAEKDKTTYIEFPNSFHVFMGERASSVKANVAAMNNPNLKSTRGTLALKYPEVFKLFEPVFENIAGHLEDVLRIVGRVDYMILVGGFATSTLLQTYLRDRFEKRCGVRIIIPPETSLAVVMGAVLFGHDPSEVVSRRVRYSYGVECLGTPDLDLSDLSRSFNPSSDPFSEMMRAMLTLSSKTLMFKTFVKKNQEVEIDEEVTHPFFPVRDDQTAADIVVYESDKEKTMTVNEEGVRKIAEFQLPMPDTCRGRDREILVSMKFGQTEIKVHSIDQSSGKKVEGTVKLDFLNLK